MDSDDTIYQNIFFTFGLKDDFASYLKKRTEWDLNSTPREFEKHEWELFFYCLYEIVPPKMSLMDRFNYNILMLDIITSYRGWRHFRGLPVRGQRTWSNAWSCYKSNTVMRNLKFNMAKNFLGNIPFGDIKVAALAESINDVWRNQWEIEWVSAKNSRLRFSGNQNTIKIDIHSMANNQVMHPLKLKNLSKKQKQSFKKNYFSLGFDTGFTKPLLANLYNIDLDDNSDNPDFKNMSIILRSNAAKKANPKKKSDLNKKK